MKTDKSKFITLKFEAKDWKLARWVINSFHCAINDCYLPGSQRRIEAEQLAKNLHEQARKQVNKLLSKKTRIEDHYDT